MSRPRLQYKTNNKTKEAQNAVVVTPQPRTLGLIYNLFASSSTIAPIVVPVPVPYPQPVPQYPISTCCGRPRPIPPPNYPRPFPNGPCCNNPYGPCSGCRLLPPQIPGNNFVFPNNGMRFNPYNYGRVPIGGGFGGFGNGLGADSNIGPGIGMIPGGNGFPGLGPGMTPGLGAGMRPGLGPGIRPGLPIYPNTGVPQSATSSFGSIGNVAIGSSSSNTGSFFSALLAMLG